MSCKQPASMFLMLMARKNTVESCFIKCPWKRNWFNWEIGWGGRRRVKYNIRSVSNYLIMVQLREGKLLSVLTKWGFERSGFHYNIKQVFIWGQSPDNSCCHMHCLICLNYKINRIFDQSPFWKNKRFQENSTELQISEICTSGNCFPSLMEHWKQQFSQRFISNLF